MDSYVSLCWYILYIYIHTHIHTYLHVCIHIYAYIKKSLDLLNAPEREASYNSPEEWTHHTSSVVEQQRPGAAAVART